LAGALEHRAETADRGDRVLFTLIASSWLAVATFSVAMCQAAARGDDMRAVAKQLRNEARRAARRSAATVGRYGS
jgi:hypothetical protein